MVDYLFCRLFILYIVYFVYCVYTLVLWQLVVYSPVVFLSCLLFLKKTKKKQTTQGFFLLI